ncbi:MAG: Dyp-type peroxidase [Acidobacteriota bacterium]|nr:Dyp-type peroxidase [Acidobacteriota bacterium]
MTEPQAILSPITPAAIFLTLTLEPGAEQGVRETLANVSGLTRSVGFRIPEGALTCVTAIGADAWDALFGRPRPAALHPFRELRGPRHSAPATRGDLFFHIRARRLDMCFELAQLLVAQLGPQARVVDEVHGFRSFDDRDLLGFVDGTENPDGAAAQAAAIVGEEDPGFAGGSYVVVQKYLHDLQTWNALTTEAQERVIGRTKLDDVELPDALKPPDSHVALNTIVDEHGAQRQIMRFNMPFGHVGAAEFGTYFIGYARDPEVIEQMLQNMFVGEPPGNTDRVLDFSTAHTGNLFFVPPAAFLDDPPGPAVVAGEEETVAAAAAPTGPADGSLGIGSLKGERQ